MQLYIARIGWKWKPPVNCNINNLWSIGTQGRESLRSRLVPPGTSVSRASASCLWLEFSCLCWSLSRTPLSSMFTRRFYTVIMDVLIVVVNCSLEMSLCYMIDDGSRITHPKESSPPNFSLPDILPTNISPLDNSPPG